MSKVWPEVGSIRCVGYILKSILSFEYLFVLKHNK